MAGLDFDSEGHVEHRGHRVWWGSLGDDRPGVPLLAVHGGPGMPHDCLEPLAALADDRRVVFYDQFGCGRSDRSSDPKDYSVELLVDELAAVRRGAGLGEVHLLAHSYAGPLVLTSLLERGQEGVRSLVLSNTFASVPALAEGWAALHRALSPEAQRALAEGPSAGEAYGAALGEFIGRFVLPGPLPEAMARAQAASGGEVYVQLHGPSWFEPQGEWSDFDVTDRLGEIHVPALVVGGEQDQCVPSLAESLHAGITGSQLAVLPTAHLPFFEAPELFFPLVRDVLAAHD